MTTIAVVHQNGTYDTDRAIMRELRERIAEALARMNDGQTVIDEATLRQAVHDQVQAYQRWARQENRERLVDPDAAEQVAELAE